MGYSTDFLGTLYFTSEMNAEKLKYLESFFGEDVRDHPDWSVPQNKYGPAFYYIKLKLNKNKTGIEWNGWEKTHGMKEQICFILDTMMARYPDFGLHGVFEAQGEEPDDHWYLVVDQTVFIWAVISDDLKLKLSTPPLLLSSKIESYEII